MTLKRHRQLVGRYLTCPSLRRIGILDVNHSPTDQRAATVAKRPKSLRGRDGGASLIEVARILRFGGLLDLESVCVVELTTVGPHDALTHQRIAGRHLFHLRYNRLPISVALHPFVC